MSRNGLSPPSDLAGRRATARDPDRFELKYWVPEEVVPRIVEYAAPYLMLDPHGVKGADRQQCNTSLYLETRGLDLFRAHVDSYADRYKLRVRAYGDPPSGLAFFEMKRKLDNRCLKTRAAVPLKEVKPLIEGTYTSLPAILSPVDRRHLEAFLYAVTVTQAAPFVLVRAYRESYCSRDRLEDVRLTFDRQIGFQPISVPDLCGSPDAWSPINGEEQHGRRGPQVLVELKFPKVAPYWMRKLIDRLELERVAFSKYVSSVRAMLEEPGADQYLWDAAGARYS
ncbi:MAG TPA: polyphosphate polymerase domain-containing protein [Polyangia bacterium]